MSKLKWWEYLWIVVISALFIAIAFPGESQARPTWEPAQASYYTLFNQRTACGKTAGPDTWFVSSLKKDTANCGLRITICHRYRCVKVTVQDRGAWRKDNRRWDLQPKVKRALRCGDLCDVRWKRTWI